MWLLSFLPEYVIHLTVALGALGVILTSLFGSFRYIAAYTFPIKIFSFIVLLCGIWLEGGIGVNAVWEAKVKEIEEKVAVAEEQSKETNVKIQTKVVEKIKVVKETRDANIQYVDRIVTKYDDKCTLSNAAIVLHDSSSRNEVAGSAGAANEGTSDVKASELVRTVTENYGTYYQVREQLIGFQEWYKEQKKIFESVK